LLIHQIPIRSQPHLRPTVAALGKAQSTSGMQLLEKKRIASRISTQVSEAWRSHRIASVC